jgi:hypothetical protein
VVEAVKLGVGQSLSSTAGHVIVLRVRDRVEQHEVVDRAIVADRPDRHQVIPR